MDFHVLGPLEVVAGDLPLPVRRGRLSTLLLALLCRVNETVSVDVLVDDVWGDDPPQHPEGALQVQVSLLRKTLGLSTLGSRPPALVTRFPGYSLVVDPASIDATRFEQCVDRAAAELGDGAAGADRALGLLAEADALWRGDPFADVAYAEFAQGWARRLAERRMAAIETRAEALLALGRIDEAVTGLAQAVTEAPLREHRHALLMRGLYLQGRQAEALRNFDRARALLLDELGVDPGVELREMHARVLAQDPTLGRGDVDRAHPPLARPSVTMPRRIGSFVGRDHELVSLRALVDSNRMVTVCGPAGVGKTRLAQEVVAALAADGAEVVFVRLDAVMRDPGEALASALGARLRPRGDAAGAIEVALADRRLVVAVDNCEHVAGEVASIAVALLERCPGVRMLATSRMPIGLHGEVVFRLDPLQIEHDAVRLFLDRAAVSDARREVAAADIDVVAEICRRLDGLPLAIELAAAQLDVFDVRAVRDLLGAGRDLKDARLPGDPRHASLRTAIEWSTALLSDDTRRCFEALGVFVDGFTREAAEAVAAPGLPGSDHLSELVRVSLVRRLEGDRYRMLAPVAEEAVRGLERDPHRAALARERHARWCADWALVADLGSRGDDSEHWMRELRAEAGNLGAALDWCFANDEPRLGARLAASMAWYWVLAGAYREADRWLSTALARHSTDDRVRAAVLAGAVLHASSLGDNERTERLGSEALGSVGIRDRPRLQAIVLGRLGTAAWSRGRLAEAAARQDQALELYRSIGDEWNIAVACFLRARTAVAAGEPDADQMMRRALLAARATGDPYPVAIVLDSLARVALDEGRAPRAHVLASEAKRLADQHRLEEVVISVGNTLGLVLSALGDRGAAWAHHSQALRGALRISFLAAACEGLEGAGLIAEAEADRQTAARLLCCAQERRRAAGLQQFAPLAGLVAAAGERLRAQLGSAGWSDALLDGGSWSDADVLATVTRRDQREGDAGSRSG